MKAQLMFWLAFSLGSFIGNIICKYTFVKDSWTDCIAQSLFTAFLLFIVFVVFKFPNVSK